MPNCTPGNKACGKRCIPESYNCGAQDAGADISQLETRRTGVMERVLNIGGKKRVTAAAAQNRMAQMEKEAYELAGGKKKYEKELEKIIRDSGGGIKARIIRNSMRKLAPNLIKADDLSLYLTVKKRGKYEEQIYRKDRSKFRQSDIIRKGDRLKKGDIIRVRFGGEVAGGFGYHYGVYMGDGRVVQYGNQYIDEKTGKLIKTSEISVSENTLKNLNKKYRLKWEKVPVKNTKYSPEELEARIKKVKGTKVRYNIMSNNCEHFAYLLTQDKAYSSQADVSTGTTGAIVKALFHYVQLQRRRKSGSGHMEFKHLDAFNFKELGGRKFTKKKRIQSPLDEDFKFPFGINDVYKALEKAKKFAKESSNEDKHVEMGVLAGWMKEYIENITAATI